MTSETVLRDQIVATARALEIKGLGVGRSGNVSARCGDGMLITPSALSYDQMTSNDIVLVDADEQAAPGAMKPSSEWRFHLAIYGARPEAEAVVHCHSRYATALACLRREIPAFHYMVAAAGGKNINCAEYAIYGTEALSENVLAALKDRKACLMANHGQVAFGPTLEDALELAQEVEALAAQYLSALHAGEPELLSDVQMDEVIAKFADYRITNQVD